MCNLLSDIARIINTAEKHRGAYWWSAPGSAAARRLYERENTCPEITWTEGGHEYSAAYTVQCSCRNVYAQGTYTRDGSRTTLTAIRNSYKRMAAQAGTV